MRAVNDYEYYQVKFIVIIITITLFTNDHSDNT